MTRTAPAAQQPKPQPRYILGPGADFTNLLLPEHASAVPPAVAEANAEALVRHVRYHETRAEMFAAKDRLKQAPAIDRQAAAAASASGEELPAPIVTARAKAAFAEAQRQMEAASDAYRAAVLRLCRTISEHKAQWATRAAARRTARSATRARRTRRGRRGTRRARRRTCDQRWPRQVPDTRIRGRSLVRTSERTGRADHNTTARGSRREDQARRQDRRHWTPHRRPQHRRADRRAAGDRGRRRQARHDHAQPEGPQVSDPSPVWRLLLPRWAERHTPVTRSARAPLRTPRDESLGQTGLRGWRATLMRT